MVETSVVLLNYNGLGYLKNCLPTVLRQTYKDYEVILVDNGSTDGSKEWVEKTFPKHPNLLLKHIRKNRGFTGGNNYGARFAKGKYVVLLSNDTTVPKNWLETLIGGMKRSKAGIVSSLVPDKEVKKQVLDIIFKEHRIATMNIIGEMVLVPVPEEEIASNAVETFYVGGNTLCYRKDLFDKPFDEDYAIYAEDVYVCWRARLLGERCKVVLDSQIEHLGAGSKYLSAGVNKIAVFNGMKNQWLNFLIFYEAKNIVKLLPLFLVGQAGHVVHRPQKLIPKLKVLFWVVTNARLIVKKRRAMQRTRNVPDDDLIGVMSCQFFNDSIERLPPLLLQVTRIMNVCFKAYCRLFRIRTRELRPRPLVRRAS